MKISHLREHVVRPTLKYLAIIEPKLNSKSAENLLLGTIAQESACGEYLVQLDGGPALGIFQMEPATHDDIWDNFLKFRPAWHSHIHKMLTNTFCNAEEELIFNMRYACAMARLKYWRVPEKMPRPQYVAGLGTYWKSHYNTSGGKGTIVEFIENYKRYEIGVM